MRKLIQILKSATSDLNQSDWLILEMLSLSAKPLKTAELVEYGFPKATLSRSLRKLIQKGWVEKTDSGYQVMEFKNTLLGKEMTQEEQDDLFESLGWLCTLEENTSVPKSDKTQNKISPTEKEGCTNWSKHKNTSRVIGATLKSLKF